MYCVVAASLGFIGFVLTLVASAAEVCGIMEHANAQYSTATLTHWPSTISELNSDWQSSRGRIFFGFMLSTAALLFASKMPYELDTLPMEEKDVGPADAVYVCCFADCAPCDVPCSRFPCCGGGRTSRCWMTPACGIIERKLLFLRGALVPLGVLFVALCPTVNFWTVEKPGAGVVRAVHLSAAATLFAGGFITEAVRMYFLWCQSRAVGIADGDLDARRHSCIHCVRSPLHYKGGVGSTRPWLICCLSVGFLGAAISMGEEQASAAPTLRVARGDVVLSPVATAFCPQPDFRYLEIDTLSTCHAASDRLRVEWERCLDDPCLTEPHFKGQPCDKPVFCKKSANVYSFNASSSNLAAHMSCVVSALSRVKGDAFHQTKYTWDVVKAVRPVNLLNRRCIIMNFNESANTCESHNEFTDDASAQVSFISRCDTNQSNSSSCNDKGQTDCEQTTLGLLGTRITAVNSDISNLCCRQPNGCPVDTLVAAATDVWPCSPPNGNCTLKKDYLQTDPRIISTAFTCPTAVIAPSYVGVCICEPSDTTANKCEYTHERAAEGRLRLFIQESILAMTLLCNYLVIALEHLIRNPPDDDPQDEARLRFVALRLLRLAVPLMTSALIWYVKAYIMEHNIVPAPDSRPGVMEDIWYRIANPGVDFFMWQLRFYWTGGACVVLMLLNDMLPKRPCLASGLATIAWFSVLASTLWRSLQFS